MDAGDCMNCTSPDAWSASFEILKQAQAKVGDGFCHGALNHAACGYDGGDCDEWNAQFPDCRMGDHSCSTLNASFPGCVVSFPEWLSDSECDYYGNNNVRCKYDGGDCLEENLVFNAKFPDCLGGDHSCATFNATYPGCIVEDPPFVGDGICDGASYNTEACEWDGGDCEWWDILYPDCRKGDQSCSSWKVEYPECFVTNMEWVGDGGCDQYVGHNVSGCEYDGGDCLFDPQYVPTLP